MSNPEKKDLYDKYGMEGVKQGAGGGGFGDLFEMFGMGGRRGPKKPQKGKPVLKELKVTLEEVFSGKLFKIPHSKKQSCESCDGKGGSNLKKCPTCKGQGMVVKMQMLGTFFMKLLIVRAWNVLVKQSTLYRLSGLRTHYG